jgi:hypothetical protein
MPTREKASRTHDNARWTAGVEGTAPAEGDVELDRRNDAAGPQYRSLRLQHCRGIGHVHQHETRDDGVVRAPRRRLLDVADREPHALELPLPRADRRLRHGVRRTIDSEDFSRGADEVGNDECHVSRGATKVEHAHPSRMPAASSSIRVGGSSILPW